ncbi:biosynthetic-type acetolactate synthase large subunit [bacterium]
MNGSKNTKRTKKNGKVKSGGEILVQTLLDEGVDTIFGYPGGVLLDIYDVFYKTPQLRHILVRHEQGAAHAADGYARSTGKPGVVIVTSGPGATNTVTGIATAFMDSIPLVVFTGQVPSVMIGNDAFQEADIIGITRPITKHSYLVRDVNRLQQIIQEAFHIATTGRPGPVIVDLPRDVLVNKGAYIKSNPIHLQGYNPVYEGHQQQIEKAAKLINDSERPLIYAGGGVNLGGAADELQELAKQAKIPVTTTLLGLGVFPEDHSLSLGMVGMHGTWYANMAISNCDVLVAVGSRFDDRVTGKLNTFSVNSRKIHIDIDPSNISKNVYTDVPIVGHVKNILPLLKKLLKEPGTDGWLQTIEKWKKEHPLHYSSSNGKIYPQHVIQMISEVTRREAIVVTDVGQNQMWAAQYYNFKMPRSILSSGGLGTMGYGLPASIGAAIANPNRTVVCITGDGGFQMNSQELATAVYYKVPLKVVLLNNGYLGMVRQWQDLFYEKRYSHTHIRPGNPDFVKLAESYGAIGMRIDKFDDVAESMRKSMKITDRPVVMEFMVEPEENVFPMVPAGASLSDMIENGN